MENPSIHKQVTNYDICGEIFSLKKIDEIKKKVTLLNKQL